MKIKLNKFISLKLIILIQILATSIFSLTYTFASEEKTKPTIDYLKKNPKNNFYILGPGDQISLKVGENTNKINSIFVINGQGIANLKRLNDIYIEGLTLKELKILLDEEYSKYVIEPNVKLEVLRYRPISVYIDGEVEEPGQYNIDGAFTLAKKYLNEKDQNRLENEDFKRNRAIYSPADFIDDTSRQMPIIFPTLIDLIRESNGITPNANLKEIRVTRKNNISEGGGRITTNINLLAVLNLKDLSQNIRILDGDTIYIPKSNNPSSLDIAKAIKSNINPSTINVYIGGRVELPGKYAISRISTLNDALEVSGGTKVLKGSTRLIRYNNDGSVDKRKFRYKKNAKRGSFRNPYLKNGDIVFIGKSGFNIASEIINEVTSPLQGLVSIYGIYKVFD